jgi:type II secretory pathway predicted ATPase ExeA
MTRWFNVGGPCNPTDHYMLPSVERLPDLTRLIAQKSYFVLHAPRQTGKTTAMLSLAQELTAQGDYATVLVSAEVGAPFPTTPGLAEQAMLNAWFDDIRHQLPRELVPPAWPTAAAGRQIGAALGHWAEHTARPIVLFLDEIDALEDQTLVSVLRQLRDGFRRRPKAFPWSLALIGLRDVRDYKVASGGSERLHTASPFNIKTRSLTLGNFSALEVAQLYAQHTADTGQIFDAAATQRSFDLTQGQPWLVNALAKVVVEDIVPEPQHPITVAEIEQAKEILIMRRIPISIALPSGYARYAYSA